MVRFVVLKEFIFEWWRLWSTKLKFPCISVNSPPVMLTFKAPPKIDMRGMEGYSRLLGCGTSSSGCGLNQH